jgi:phenylacetate-CoA ligase
MPFVRYEVGDIGSISLSKKSSARILKSLQGRTNDIAILPSGKKSPGLTFYYISKSLLEGSVGMKEFIIKQLEPDLFLFEYTSDQYLTDEQKEKVFQAMDMYLETGLRADFERKESIERTKAGKLKHFQYLVK